MTTTLETPNASRAKEIGKVVATDVAIAVAEVAIATVVLIGITHAVNGIAKWKSRRNSK